jgi:threonine/homoserine/homoserine lactone efflux protein
MGGQVLAVGALWLVVVIIPGPNFLIVTRLAVRQGRQAALAAVLGIGIGTIIWGSAGVLGVQTVFAAFPAVYGALQMAGAAWLLVVGVRALRGAVSQDVTLPAPSAALRTGLLTSLSNPKSALLIGSLFTAVLTPHTPALTGAAMVGEIAAISLLWYSALSTVVAAPAVAATFQKAGPWIDRLAGVVFIGFAVSLIGPRLGL